MDPEDSIFALLSCDMNLPRLSDVKQEPMKDYEYADWDDFQQKTGNCFASEKYTTSTDPFEQGIGTNDPLESDTVPNDFDFDASISTDFFKDALKQDVSMSQEPLTAETASSSEPPAPPARMLLRTEIQEEPEEFKVKAQPHHATTNNNNNNNNKKTLAARSTAKPMYKIHPDAVEATLKAKVNKWRLTNLGRVINVEYTRSSHGAGKKSHAAMLANNADTEARRRQSQAFWDYATAHLIPLPINASEQYRLGTDMANKSMLYDYLTQVQEAMRHYPKLSERFVPEKHTVRMSSVYKKNSYHSQSHMRRRREEQKIVIAKEVKDSTRVMLSTTLENMKRQKTVSAVVKKEEVIEDDLV